MTSPVPSSRATLTYEPLPLLSDPRLGLLSPLASDLTMRVGSSGGGVEPAGAASGRSSQSRLAHPPSPQELAAAAASAVDAASRAGCGGRRIRTSPYFGLGVLHPWSRRGRPGILSLYLVRRPAGAADVEERRPVIVPSPSDGGVFADFRALSSAGASNPGTASAGERSSSST